MPSLLLALLCSLLAAIPMSVAGLPCADDFAALKAVLGDGEGDYPELKDYATYLNFLTSCDDLKNSPLLAMIPDRQPGENACTMPKSKLRLSRGGVRERKNMSKGGAKGKKLSKASLSRGGRHEPLPAHGLTRGGTPTPGPGACAAGFADR